MGEPLWNHLLFGKGNFVRSGAGIELHSRDPSVPTLLALDDAGERWFSFTTELGAGKKERVRHGVFFGWRYQPHDPEVSRRFFVVKFQEWPLAPGDRPRLKIGSGYLVPPKGPRGGTIIMGHPLPGVPEVELQPQPPSGWRQLSVRAVNGRVEIAADSAPPVHIDLVALRRRPELADMDPRGALGVWAEDGMAGFRRASDTVYDEGR
jgi:hypothetical protein